VKYLLITGLLALSVTSVNAAECHFKTPKIDTDVCKNLNISSDIKDNSFYINSEQGVCGASLSLPGLKDFNLGKYVPNTGVCHALKYVTGGQLINNINKFLHF